MLEDLQPRKPQRTCAVATMKKELDEKDQELLEGYMADDFWSPYRLSVALADRGLKIAADSLRRHMRGICSCSMD